MGPECTDAPYYKALLYLLKYLRKIFGHHKFASCEKAILYTILGMTCIITRVWLRTNMTPIIIMKRRRPLNGDYEMSESV